MRITDSWFDIGSGRIELGHFDAGIFCGSFEPRCTALSKVMDLRDTQTHIFLTRDAGPSGDYKNMPESELIRSVRVSGSEPSIHRIYLSSPRNTWVNLDLIVRDLVRNNARTLVDITTMPRELTAMITAAFGLNYLQGGRVSFGYVPAEAYDLDQSWEEMWLSRGVRDIRAIIGYEGKSGSGSNHLVLLNGFELERAQSIVSRFEPAGVSIAVTAEQGSTHPKFAQVQEAFATEIVRNLASPPLFLKIYPKSCSDTYESLKEHLKLLDGRVESRNLLVAPLNTKPSSLATFLLGLERRDIQVVYAEPQIYNSAHYSEPQQGFYEITLQ